MAKDKTNDNATKKMKSKKDTVLNQKKSSRIPLLMGLLAVVLLGGGVMLSKAFHASQPSSHSASPTVSPTQTSAVTYPLALFEDRKAKHNRTLIFIYH